MKIIYYLFVVFSCIFLFGCQADENTIINDCGYLRLVIGEDNSLNARIASDYNPKQLAVQILNADGKVVKTTNNWEAWKDTQIPLSPGTYTVQASSNGFDGEESGWDIPYYAGSNTVKIETGKEANTTVTCTLANVKVTVEYASDLLSALGEGTIDVEVGAVDKTKCTPLSFAKNDTRSAYFPVTDLYTKVTISSVTGKRNTLTKEIKGVKARDYYILNFKLADSGNGKFNITVDDKNNVYNYNFVVSPKPTANAIITGSAWTTFAYLMATEVTMPSGETMDPNKVKFEYKQKDTENWLSVIATPMEDGYSAKITGLLPETSYDYRLNYNDEEFVVTSSSPLITEQRIQLPNSGFEDWCTKSVPTAMPVGTTPTSFPCASNEYDAGNLFWDTSNPGANSTGENNPTKSTTNFYSGKYAASLTTASVFGYIAAASLYTGEFQSATLSGTATLDFGRPFTSRPTQLTGYYRYNPSTVTVDKNDNVSGMKNGDKDRCAIYILLADWNEPFRVNTGNNTFIDVENDEHIIAYGELSAEEACPVEAMTDYKKFTINLEYRDLMRSPKYIVVVCSASKYGDYFTGGAGSELLVDDFELIYGDTPQTK